MKKNIILTMGIFLIILCFCLMRVYAIEDNNSPQIDSLAISSNQFNAGDSIQITIDSHDDISGPGHIMFEWCLEGSETCSSSSQFHYGFSADLSGNNHYVATMKVPNKIIEGNWAINAIQIWDVNYNLKTYYRSNSESLDITVLDFMVHSDYVPDFELPVLTSAKVTQKNNTITMDVTATDNVTKNLSVHANYANTEPTKTDWSQAVNGILYNTSPHHTYSFELEKKSNGHYIGTFDLENDYIIYILEYITISDESNNTVYYTNYGEVLESNYSIRNWRELEYDLNVKSKNYQKDTKAPELLSFKSNKNIVYTPDQLTYDLKVFDNQSGFDVSCGTLFVRNESGTFNKGISIDIDYESGKNGYYDLYAKIDFSRYQNPGLIYAYSIVLYDVAGNLINYNIENGTLEKKIIRVVPEEQTYTLETSTTVANYIDLISNLSDGSRVLCDISSNKIVKKELFNAIKQKDITIVFEDVFGDEWDLQGIQWIINGLDITNETKDINMEVSFEEKIYSKYYDDKYLEELNESIYIDPSWDDDKLWEELKKQQKVAFEKYVQHMKEKGVIFNDNVKDKILNTLMKDDCDIGSAVLFGTGFGINYIKVNFENNGLLPGAFTVRVKPEYALREIVENKDLYLFYIGDKYIKIMDNIRMQGDNYLEFIITHNSEYMLIDRDINSNDAEKPSISVSNGKNNSLTINWNNVENATKYEIQRSTDNKKWSKLATVTEGNYVDKKLTYGKKYYYRVKAYDGTKWTKYSNVVNKKVVPNKVTLRIKSAGTNNVKLEWDKVSVTGYEVYMGTKTSNMKKIATVTKNSTLSYNKKKLKANTKYYFKVRAYKTVSGKKVYGKYSEILYTKTAPNKPSLKVSLNDYDSMKVVMGEAKGATVYRLEKSLDGKTYELFEEFPVKGTVEIGPQEVGKKYYYRVKACNSENRCSSWVYADLKQTTKAPSIKLTTSSKKVTVTLGSVNGADGYEVYRATSKKGKYTLVKTLTSLDELTFDDKTKKGKTYYYKVRSYKMVNDKKVNSPYSSIKSIRSK